MKKKKRAKRKKEVEKEKENQKVVRKEKQKKLKEKWEILWWITTYIDRNEIEWENDSLDAEITEVDTRMAAKPGGGLRQL